MPALISARRRAFPTEDPLLPCLEANAPSSGIPTRAPSLSFPLLTTLTTCLGQRREGGITRLPLCCSPSLSPLQPQRLTRPRQLLTRGLGRSCLRHGPIWWQQRSTALARCRVTPSTTKQSSSRAVEQLKYKDTVGGWVACRDLGEQARARPRRARLKPSERACTRLLTIITRLLRVTMATPPARTQSLLSQALGKRPAAAPAGARPSASGGRIERGRCRGGARLRARFGASSCRQYIKRTLARGLISS